MESHRDIEEIKAQIVDSTSSPRSERELQDLVLNKKRNTIDIAHDDLINYVSYDSNRRVGFVAEF